MRSISASVFDTAGWVTDRNSDARPRWRNSSSATSSCRCAQLEVGAQNAVDIAHRQLHNPNGMKRVRYLHLIRQDCATHNARTKTHRALQRRRQEMHTTRRQFVLGSLGAAAAVRRRTRAPSPPDYPERPITFICPWPAGGTADLTMRALCAPRPRQLGQTIVVENKAGASGHDRPEGHGQRQAGRLHDRPDPDLGDALLAARHRADRSAEGPDLHRPHLGPDLRHRGARRCRRGRR